MKHIIAHPPVDFSVPFRELRPEQITIYFHYTNETGKNTCKASCEHCYFMSKPEFKIPVIEATAITKSLRGEGYKIGLAPADTFTDEALMTEESGSAFRLKTIGTSAWTSGVPLFLPGWREKLDRASAAGYRSIIISAHESADTFVPIRGVTKAPVIEQAIANIKQWNEDQSDEKRFSIATTFTIRKDNCDLDQIRKMVKWGVMRKIDLVRFNCFANFRSIPWHTQYEMSRDDIAKFFGILAELQKEFLDTKTSLGISEDFGDAGIEQIYEYLPAEWQNRTHGWCSAGYRLFAMIKIGDEIVVVGCVDKWEPILGVVKKTINGKQVMYHIDWFYDRIDSIRRAILSDSIYACWGGVGYGRKSDAGFSVNKKSEFEIFKESEFDR